MESVDIEKKQSTKAHLWLYAILDGDTSCLHKLQHLVQFNGPQSQWNCCQNTAGIFVYL